MAIAFTKVLFMRLLPNAGTCKILAYNSRSEVFDHRLGKMSDCRALDADLVHDAIITLGGADPAFATLEKFGNAVDAAELAHVRRPLTDRMRYPQIGAAIVVALPPDSEVTLDESIEIPHRMVDRVRGDRRLVIHAAVHEPALITLGAMTRHVHLFIP